MREDDHLDTGAACVPAPVTDEDLQVPLASYRDGAKRGGFESGIEMAIRSILVSPDFLFRLESQPAGAAPNTPYRLSDLDLASRLSFFLWSSIPDDELVKVAEKNNLQQARGAAAAGAADACGSALAALVDNFAGQWLHIRNVAGHQPSPEVLFHYDDNLRKAFEQETKLFFESIVRENRSVIDLLDADYTFLNERLAKHYGIPGVSGERFRRVPLAARQPAPRAARPGLDSDGDVVSESDVAGHPRQMDSREHFRRAAATAAAERARAEGRARPAEGAADARADGRAPRESGVRGLPRADGPAGLRARELRRRSASGATSTRQARGLTRRRSCRTAPSSTARQSCGRC